MHFLPNKELKAAMKIPSRLPLLTIAALVCMASLGGCVYAPPQAWEKGNLAKPAMTMNGDPLDQRFAQHIYASKENASGGYGVGGGGCGCN
jgi:hypothetical protein